jgi:ABC-type transport system involved in multi-copper enzyme maturation permease subunit
MLPGPVFNVELLTTARRPRYYALRLLYGLILLGLISSFYSDTPMFRRLGIAGGEVSIAEMASFAQVFFSTFAVTQAVMVLMLAPTLLAGVIVEEKQRNTLAYLLASPLTSGEIVLGKLLARLLHLAVFLGVGLPILSLMTLFGGIDPVIVAAVYACTLTSAFFLAGLSIFVSTIARKVREALVLVYMIELAWLILPLIIEATVRTNWPGIYPWVAMVNDWFLYSTPSAALIVVSRRGLGFSAVYWMMGLQLTMGLALVGFAVGRLRPIFRAQSESRGRLATTAIKLKAWRWRLLPRPACGADAMLWKELHVSRTSGLVKLIAVSLALVFGALLAWAVIDVGTKALGELQVYGYRFTTRQEYNSREDFNGLTRSAGTAIYVLLLLGVAASAATCVTSEREADTWTSLTSSPLSGAEILRAKMLGAVWSMRALLAALFFLWTIGLFLGAVHPVAFFFEAVELAVFLTFTSAFGTYQSLRSKTSLRAQATTIGTLVFLNGGYLMCCAPLTRDTTVVAAGCTPFIVAASLVSYREVSELLGDTPRWTSEAAVTCIFGFVVYTAATIGMVSTCVRSFDKLIDRPRHEFPPASPTD